MQTTERKGVETGVAVRGNYRNKSGKEEEEKSELSGDVNNERMKKTRHFKYAGAKTWQYSERDAMHDSRVLATYKHECDLRGEASLQRACRRRGGLFTMRE